MTLLYGPNHQMTRLYSGSFCISMSTSLGTYLIMPNILYTIRFLVARLGSRPRWPSLFLSPAFLAQAALVSIHYHKTKVPCCLFLKSYRSSRDGDNFLRRCRPDWSKIKHAEPITICIVLVAQRHSNNEKVILKLADMGYRGTNKGADTVR